jgi:hypothetical protein
MSRGLVVVVASVFLAFGLVRLDAQRGNPQPPRAPRAAAPIDLTGYWVAIVTQDWRWRMVTPRKGDYQGIPITPAAAKVADTWDPAKDEAAGQQCKSYGAPALMSVPGRIHITWQDDNTLKVDTDAGEQTRLLRFGAAQTTANTTRTWQGVSQAEWLMARPNVPLQLRPAERTADTPPIRPTGGSLQVVTRNLRAGYLRKNGVPYSENAVLTEYFDLHPGPGDSTWITLTAIVNDPKYLGQEFITSTATLGTFRKDDTILVHFIGAWDDCSSGKHPSWVIDSMKLDIVPMTIQDFASGNGGFTAVDSGTPPAGWGGWAYQAASGTWAAQGAPNDSSCGGPFNSKLTSPAYTVPVSDEVTLSFTHRYSLEGDYFDGGQVWISVNGGAFTPVSPDNFSANGYASGTIVGTGILNGQRAFNGDSAGYATNGFITSSVVLGAFNQNDTIAVQFVGAWDEFWGPAQPSWVIKSLQLAYGKAAKASTFESLATASKQGQPVTVSYQWQRNDGAGFVEAIEIP